MLSWGITVGRITLISIVTHTEQKVQRTASRHPHRPLRISRAYNGQGATSEPENDLVTARRADALLTTPQTNIFVK